MISYTNAAGFAVVLVINLMILGLPIVLGIALAFKLTRLSSPRGRYVIVVAAFFIVSLLPVVITLNAYREPVSILAPASDIRRLVSDTSPNAAHTDTTAAQLRPVRDTFDANSQSLVSTFDLLLGLVIESWLAKAFLGVWIIIAALLLGSDALGHVRLARARRSWQPASEVLREELAWPKSVPLCIDERAGPCAVGLFRLAVVVPAQLLGDLPPGVLGSILRHELDHVKWHDPLINTLLRIVRALLWPSAPLWFLERVTRLEREAAADHAAITSLQSRDDYRALVIAYATALGSVAKRFARGSLMIEASGRSGLEERVCRLLAITSGRPSLVRLSLAGLILIVSFSGLTVLPVASHPSVLYGSVSSLSERQLEGDSPVARSDDYKSPEERIDRKAEVVVAGDEATIRELADAVFEVPKLLTIPKLLALPLKERMIQAEVSYRNGGRVGVTEESIVRAVDELAQKFGAPDFARTGLDEVRDLRLMTSYSMPHFIARQPLVNPTDTERRIGFSINSVMSPLEAIYIIQALILQKESNEYFLVTPAERDEIKSILQRLDGQFQLTAAERGMVMRELILQKIDDQKSQRAPEELASMAKKWSIDQGNKSQKAYLSAGPSSPRLDEMQSVMRRANSMSVRDAVELTQKLLGIVGV